MRTIFPNKAEAVTSTRDQDEPPVRLQASGSAVVRPLSLIGAELDAPALAGERPFWQGEPCPSWCEAAGSGGSGHSGLDAYQDRRHVLFGTDVLLSLCDAECGRNGADAEPLFLELMAAQHYRAMAPDVAIVVPLPADRPGAPVEHEVRLTVGETRALRDALDELLAVLDGGAR